MFFFFKKKTAYEMRISDWSSDVCSSDLLARVAGKGEDRRPSDRRRQRRPRLLDFVECRQPVQDPSLLVGADDATGRGRWRQCLGRSRCLRSEEHTSELQSLMRISYAVFCLKKKKKNKATTTKETS